LKGLNSLAVGDASGVLLGSLLIAVAASIDDFDFPIRVASRQAGQPTRDRHSA
jgi:hypothetical protein